MNINAINGVKNSYIVKNNKTEKLNNANNLTHYSDAKLMAYPSNFYVSFTGLSVDEIMDGYGNIVPQTVKDYIENQEALLSKDEFEAMKNGGFKSIQVAAFEDLQDCKTVEDVKEKFPYEDLFKNLKNIEDVETSKGFFATMRDLEKEGIKTIDIDEDIAVFVLKKIYLDCLEYQQIFQEIDDKMTPEAREAGLCLPGRISAANDFYLPLGIDAPNGRIYQKIARFSDPTYVKIVQKHFSNLSPEEINEKIVDFLRSDNTKKRYSMMDAWNHCEDVRRDLSKFLIDNIDNPKYNVDQNVKSEAISIYDDKFYSKMHYLMCDFWETYPQHKEKLGEETSIALKRFDKYKKEDNETLKRYINDIEQKSKEIRKSIQLDKLSYKQNHPKALELLNHVVNKTNILNIKTQSAVDDFIKLLQTNITNYEMNILEGEKDSPEFKELVPEGIKAKLRETVKMPQFANIASSQHIALLEIMLEQGMIDEKSIDNILKSGASLKEVVAQMLAGTFPNVSQVKLPIEEMEDRYNVYKKQLSGFEANELRETLIANNPDFDYEDSLKLDKIISSQGKYLTHVLKGSSLSNLVQVLLWKEFDRQYDTNYSQSVLEGFEFNEYMDNIIDLTEKLDANDLVMFAWQA